MSEDRVLVRELKICDLKRESRNRLTGRRNTFPVVEKSGNWGLCS